MKNPPVTIRLLEADVQKVDDALRAITATLEPYLLTLSRDERENFSSLVHKTSARGNDPTGVAFTPMDLHMRSIYAAPPDSRQILQSTQQTTNIRIDSSGNTTCQFDLITSRSHAKSAHHFSIDTSNPAEIKQIHIAPGDTKKKHTPLISPSEMRILYYIREGLTSKEIAGKLHLSEHTVNTHRRNMLEKTGTQNSAELVNFAVVHSFV